MHELSPSCNGQNAIFLLFLGPKMGLISISWLFFQILPIVQAASGSPKLIFLDCLKSAKLVEATGIEPATF
jgi:hypothetical protein